MVRDRVLDPETWLTVAGLVAILPAVALLAGLLARRHAATAHAMLVAGLASALIGVPVVLGARAAGLGVFGGVTELPATLRAALPPIPETVQQTSSIPWLAIALATWGAVTAILLGRLAWFIRRERQLLAATTPLTDHAVVRHAAEVARSLGIRRAPAIRVASHLRAPLIWCWSRVPTIVVPAADLDALDDDAWVGVLAHELAHWRRRDHLSALLVETAACVLWWHPLVWAARRITRRLAEECCDAWAAPRLIAPDVLASVLLRYAVPNAAPSPARAALAMSARRSTVGRRIVAVLDRSDDAAPLVRRRRVAAVALVLSLTSLAAATAHRRPPTPAAQGVTLVSVAPETVAHLDATAAPVRLTPSALDLGVVAPGGTGHGEAWIVNISARPIELDAVRASCGCTTVSDFAAGPLPPYTAMRLGIQMNAPETPETSKTKQVTVVLRAADDLVLPVTLRTAATAAAANGP